MGSQRSRMVETRHVRPTCFVLLSVQGKQLCPCKLNLYMLYLLCFVMFVHISCFFSLCSPYLEEIKKSSSSSFVGAGQILCVSFFPLLRVGCDCINS